MSGALLSLAVLAGILLCGGGGMLIVKGREPRKGLLMIAAGVVLFGNVAIWAVPV